jgi:UTP:GlnB (protein PII) uridylyltransferase
MTLSFVTIVMHTAQNRHLVNIFRKHIIYTPQTYRLQRTNAAFVSRRKNISPVREKNFSHGPAKVCRNQTTNEVTDNSSINYGNPLDKYHLVKMLQNH